MSRRTIPVWAPWLVAIAMATTVSVAQAQTIGRFFSTVEQRIELDEVRDEYEYGKPPKPPERKKDSDAEVASRPAVPDMTVNGVVLRSSGHNATWVNGQAILGGQTTADGIRVVPRRARGAGSVRLVLPSGTLTQPIKPGQKVDVAEGLILDTYQLNDRERAKNKLFEPATPASTTPVSTDPVSTDPASPSGAAPRPLSNATSQPAPPAAARR